MLVVRQAVDDLANPWPPGAAASKEYIRAQAFPGKLEQVREARTFAAGFINGLPLADDVVLCVSEFSANAALHSRSREGGGRFVVRIEVHAPLYTWIEVEDDGGPWRSHVSPSLAGHGLDIVDKISSEWGIDGDGEHGWVVWARFDWPGS